MNSGLTVKKLLELRARLDAEFPNPPLIAIVCRPGFDYALRKITERSNPLLPPLCSFGPEVYIDRDQEAEYLPFYDRELLHEYLNRNEKPNKRL